MTATETPGRDPDGVRLGTVAHADAQVGEGPHHLAATGELLWVDIPAGRVHRTAPGTGETRTETVGTMVGAAVPAARGVVAATREGFAVIEDGRLDTRRPVLPEGERMNDAKCDPHGRLWAGSTAIDFTDDAGRLWVLDTRWREHLVLEGMTLPNGLGWTPDARTFYLIDSYRHELCAFDAPGPDSTTLRHRRVVRRFGTDGVPDGLAVDTAGCCWVAIWGGARIVRISPEGDELRRIEMPVAQPSSCAFGGPDRDVLFVTSAAVDQPAGGADGSVFALHGLGATGVPVAGFAG